MKKKRGNDKADRENEGSLRKFDPDFAGLSETIHDPTRYLDRELSRIAFDRRVLNEANNINNPLAERIRFLAISASNTDEFYSVRVAGLIGLTREDVKRVSLTGKKPQEQLKDIYAETEILLNEQQETLKQLKAELKSAGVEFVTNERFTENDKPELKRLFEEELLPSLTPLALDPAHPFPFIPHQGLGVIFKLQDMRDNRIIHTVITVPQQLKRFYRLDAPAGEIRFVTSEDVIIANAKTLFSSYTILGHGHFKLLRDTGIEIEEDAEDLVREFENALRRRRHGNVVRIKIHADTPEELCNILQSETEQDETGGSVIIVDGMIGLSNLSQIVSEELPGGLFPPHKPRTPVSVRLFNGDMFRAITEKDILLHHPYDSFDPVIHFIHQAAHDPDVTTVRITLYRTSEQSPIVSALAEAAENGKNVTVAVELKARFDEAANIRVSKILERAGAHVVFGFTDRKTHAKTAAVVRRENGKFKTYAHFGTGNYHPVTAKLYTDLSLFTCREPLASDAAQLFHYITGYIEPYDMRAMKIAPLNLKSTLLEQIETEKQNALAGKPSGIYAKMNSLGEKDMIEALYSASQAGVPIKLNIRGICCLRPGVTGLSENIEVVSNLGRFLEHSRIAAFANGSPYPSPDTKVFISSADWMSRNLERRIETLVPILDEDMKIKICKKILEPYFQNTFGASALQSNGTYIPVEKDKPFNVQDYFIKQPFE